MKIEQTQLVDLDRVCQLWRSAIQFQKEKGYPVYASDDRAGQKRSIADGLHYKLIHKNRIVGIFNLKHTDPLIWREDDSLDAVYLAGVIIDRKLADEFLFGAILDWIVKYAREHNKCKLRLDTWANNPKLENYYQHFGFNTVGKYQTPDDEDIPDNCQGNLVVLMEKLI